MIGVPLAYVTARFRLPAIAALRERGGAALRRRAVLGLQHLVKKLADVGRHRVVVFLIMCVTCNSTSSLRLAE